MASYETYKSSFKQITLYSFSLACSYRTPFNEFTMVTFAKNIEIAHALNLNSGSLHSYI